MLLGCIAKIVQSCDVSVRLIATMSHLVQFPCGRATRCRRCPLIIGVSYLDSAEAIILKTFGIQISLEDLLPEAQSELTVS